MREMRTNWSKNYRYRAAELLEPRCLEELQAMVAARPGLRALGTRHSFNGLADSEHGAQISPGALRDIALDRASNTVKVGAGVTYAALAQRLSAEGFALPNLASLPHISIVGGTATGTHGSGLRNGNLATAVESLELVLASGELRQFRSASEYWNGAALALGSLGIVSSITLRVEPMYFVRQDVYENLPFATLTRNMEAVFAGAYSISIFTDWKSRAGTQVWVKQRTPPEDRSRRVDTFFGAQAAAVERHPLPDHDAQSCTPQLGAPGPWHERLPHFRSDYVPSSGDELQTEYLVPFTRGAEAIEAVARLGDRIAPLLLVGELRAVAGDDFWLSPCSGRASLALHFTWRPQWPQVQALLPEIEAALEPFAARPHWAKLFTMPPQHVRSLYPQLHQFQMLARDLDPQGKFRNDFVDEYVL